MEKINGKLNKEDYKAMIKDLRKVWKKKTTFPENPVQVSYKYGVTAQAAYNAYNKFLPLWNAQAIRKKKVS